MSAGQIPPLHQVPACTPPEDPIAHSKGDGWSPSGAGRTWSPSQLQPPTSTSGPRFTPIGPNFLPPEVLRGEIDIETYMFKTRVGTDTDRLLDKVEENFLQLAKMADSWHGETPLAALHDEALEGGDPIGDLKAAFDTAWSAVAKGLHIGPQGSMAAPLGFWGGTPTENLRDAKDPMGRGGVLMLEERSWSTDRRDTKIAEALQNFAGEDNVHIVPSSADRERKAYTPFLRNIVAEGPNSMLIPSKVPTQYEATRSDVEKELTRMGVKHERVEGMINFANVEYFPPADLLVLADARWGIDPAMRPYVESLFGNPKNVIHFALNETKLNPLKAPLCYDADLAFHALRNPDGQWIALFHAGCVQKAPDGSDLMDANAAEKALKALNFIVIHISAADQQLLAANSLSLHDLSGKLQLSHPGVSADLLKELRKNGITPVLPDQVLGEVPSPTGDNGIHCLTVSLRLPEGTGAPGNEAAKKSSTWGKLVGMVSMAAVAAASAVAGVQLWKRTGRNKQE